MIKFLIIRFSSIGDIVLTSPIIRCLKQQVQDAEVHYLTKPAFSDIVISNPHIDNVLTLKENFEETIDEIKSERYDYIIDLHNNIRTYRIKKRIGILSFSFPKLNLEKWLIVNLKIDRLPQKHIVDRYFETVKLFDVNNDKKGLDYFIPVNDNIKLDDLPSSFKNGYIGFVIGAKHITKKMPTNKITEIINKVPFPVILLGDNLDKIEADFIVNNSNNSNVYNACGKYKLNQSASIIKQARVIVTNDTGLMHIASAFRKPIISLWGNTIPEFGMFPYIDLKQSEIIEVKGLKCRPCSKIGFTRCPKKHFHCMNEIENEKVIKAIKNFWNITNES